MACLIKNDQFCFYLWETLTWATIAYFTKNSYAVWRVWKSFFISTRDMLTYSRLFKKWVLNIKAKSKKENFSMLMPLLSDINNASEIYVSLRLAVTAYPQNISSLVLVLNTSIYIFYRLFYSIFCFLYFAYKCTNTWLYFFGYSNYCKYVLVFLC